MSLIYNKLGGILDVPYNYLGNLDFVDPTTKIININSGSNIIKEKSIFDSPIDNLPEGLEELNFSIGYFNKSIDNLPIGLIKLKLGSNFNKPIDNLPKGLKYLVLGDSFDHPIDNLPETLEYLQTGFNFNHSIDNIPNSITQLYLCGLFNQAIKKYPNHLETLVFTFSFNKPLGLIPKSIKYLGLSSRFDHKLTLHEGIEKLKLGYDFTQSLDDLPDSIKYIIFNENYHKPINKYPSQLKKICLYAHSNIQNIPESVKCIKIIAYPNSSVILFDIPNTVTRIKIKQNYSHILPKMSNNCVIEYF
jgi:hypothetical protein